MRLLDIIKTQSFKIASLLCKLDLVFIMMVMGHSSNCMQRNLYESKNFILIISVSFIVLAVLVCSKSKA